MPAPPNRIAALAALAILALVGIVGGGAIFLFFQVFPSPEPPSVVRPPTASVVDPSIPDPEAPVTRGLEDVEDLLEGDDLLEARLEYERLLRQAGPRPTPAIQSRLRDLDERLRAAEPMDYHYDSWDPPEPP